MLVLNKAAEQVFFRDGGRTSRRLAGANSKTERNIW
jgi:hypothetical protein